MNELEKRVEAILNAPLGCVFMLGVEASGLTPEAAAAPENCLRLAAMAVDSISPWAAGHAQAVVEALERGGRLGDLARSILEHPASSWWFQPPDLDRQCWIYKPLGLNYDSWLSSAETPTDTANWRRPASPPSNWERYAQKPLGNQVTSTLFGNISSELMAYDERAGDYHCPFPLECWELEIQQDVRVYEVHGAESWHELCVSYPAVYKEDGLLVPDWGAAAEDWDGVHMSFGGLLSSEQARYESPEGWSMHNWWHAERTYWLRSLVTTARRLPNYEQTQGSEFLHIPWLEASRIGGTPLVSGDSASLRIDSRLRGNDGLEARLRWLRARLGRLGRE